MKKLYFLSLILFLIACGKETPSGDDYLVFGHYYGECGGEGCIEMYKLGLDNLNEDVNDRYPTKSEFYEGDYSVAMSQEDFMIASQLWDVIPDQLLGESEKIIGQPDAGDWGGLYFEYRVGSKHEFWYIDQKKDNLPDYLHSFREKINEVISIINM